MTKLKIGDKVRVLTDNTTALKDDGTIFSKGDIGVITEVDSCGVVRISNSSNSWIDVDDLEFVEEGKKVYTKDDIYEGMVLECVEREYDHWTFGKQYIVENGEIKDDDGDSRDTLAIIDYLNDPNNLIFGPIFKVIEPEEKRGIVQLFNYTFGLKTGDVETTEWYAGGELYTITNNFNKKHITIPAYNTQQAIEYLTNELEYDINDIVSLEVK